MTKTYIAELGGYTAKSLEWNGAFDLSIYEGENEIYRHHSPCYSLKDVAKVIRRKLKMPRKHIAWRTI